MADIRETSILLNLRLSCRRPRLDQFNGISNDEEAGECRSGLPEVEGEAARHEERAEFSQGHGV